MKSSYVYSTKAIILEAKQALVEKIIFLHHVVSKNAISQITRLLLTPTHEYKGYNEPFLLVEEALEDLYAGKEWVGQQPAQRHQVQILEDNSKRKAHLKNVVSFEGDHEHQIGEALGERLVHQALH